MATRWRGHAPPAPAAMPTYDVIWPKAGRPLDVTLLASQWLGVPVHWRGERGQQTRRTVLCLQHRGCISCDTLKLAQDWRGYMPVFNHESSRERVAVLVIGRDCFPRISRLVPPDQPLAGRRVIVTRIGGSDYSPIAARIAVSEPKVWRGPEPDIIPTLVKMYGAEVEDLLAGPGQDGPDGGPVPTESDDHIPFPSPRKEPA